MQLGANRWPAMISFPRWQMVYAWSHSSLIKFEVMHSHLVFAPLILCKKEL